jgi:hypothetical protein
MLFQLFKYGSIISVPLFLITGYLLARSIPGVSLSKTTLSRLIFVFNHPWQKPIFTLNFYFKMFLDVLFALYVIQILDIPFFSYPSLSWIGALVFFGLIGFFSEDKYFKTHYAVTYISAVLFVIFQLGIAIRLGDVYFLLITIANTLANCGLAFGLSIFRKQNMIIEGVCMLIMYSWVIILVYRFL